MNKYLLLYTSKKSAKVDTIEDQADTMLSFLDRVDDRIIKDCDWKCFSVSEKVTKEQAITDGSIDELVDY